MWTKRCKIWATGQRLPPIALCSKTEQMYQRHNTGRRDMSNLSVNQLFLPPISGLLLNIHFTSDSILPPFYWAEIGKKWAMKHLLLYIHNIKKHANVWVGHLKSGNTIHRQLNALYQGRGGSLGQRGQWHFRNLRTSKEEEGEADNAASQINFYATQNYLTYVSQFFWFLGKKMRNL